ncbi:MAG: zinc ABC transporter substrate-binding protein [Bacteroidota bacterium]
MNRLLLFLLPLFALAGCHTYQKKQGRKLIVCTTGYVADAVRNIAGPEAEIVALMGPGVDPHLYKASLRDVDYLSQADLIVYSGLHLEGKMSELFSRVSKTKPIIAIADGLEEGDAMELDDRGTHDPHFWFNPLLWKKGVQNFTVFYTRLNWGNPDSISSGSIAYCQMLTELDSYAKSKFRSLPPSRRYLVTPHDAFGYFCKAYGLKVKTLQGISTVAEYGIRDVSGLISFLIDKQIPTLFLESSISPKSSEAILAGCRRKGHDIGIGGELFSDALGKADSPEGTYRGVFLHNVNTIYNGLILNRKPHDPTR